MRNQTLVKTATGIWNVTYNGENRPVRWELVSPNSNTPNSNTQTLLLMSFDSMGRRVTKNDQLFVYNGYLQIANHHSSTSTSHFNYYIWDPTEPVATRPLTWQRGTSIAYYTHDGNKNVSEVVASNNDVAAHYEYAPFGALTVSRGTSAVPNPWRFSSEYSEDDTATVYYNYRHYEPVTGRWMQRDPLEEDGGVNLFIKCCNRDFESDVLGENRYITHFDIFGVGGSGGTQLHVGVAVDLWKCDNGKWVENGIKTFDFSIDWDAPWYNYLKVWKAQGHIGASPGLNLDSPITLKSCPAQDVTMLLIVEAEMENPPYYNVFHNCIFWSSEAIGYGMSEICKDCCEE